jgi:SAM-dependent methyltransferase
LRLDFRAKPQHHARDPSRRPRPEISLGQGRGSESALAENIDAPQSPPAVKVWRAFCFGRKLGCQFRIGRARIMGKSDYYTRRRTNLITEYSLSRRSEMVVQQLQRLGLPRQSILIDIGTADGQMLSRLLECRGLSGCMAVGTDLNFRYLSRAKAITPHVFQANGKRLPLCTDCTNVILCTSVFKHIIGLEELVAECHRVLEPAGKMIAIDPTPLGVQLGYRLGYFSKKEIKQALDLKSTQCILVACGFKVLNAKRFMLSPVPIKGCDAIEMVLKRLHMDRLFLYQAVCAECGASACASTQVR